MTCGIIEYLMEVYSALWNYRVSCGIIEYLMEVYSAL